MEFFKSSPIEIAFALVSLVAVCLSFFAFREAVVDAAVLDANKVNGARRMVASNGIRQEGLRLLIAFVMLTTSTSFLFLSPPPPEYNSLPQSLVGLIAWIFIGAIMATASLLERSVRMNLQKYAPMEVQTASRTVSAPAEGRPGKTTAEDVVKAAHDVAEGAGRENQTNASGLPSGGVPVGPGPIAEQPHDRRAGDRSEPPAA